MLAVERLQVLPLQCPERFHGFLLSRLDGDAKSSVQSPGVLGDEDASVNVIVGARLVGAGIVGVTFQ